MLDNLRRSLVAPACVGPADRELDPVHPQRARARRGSFWWLSLGAVPAGLSCSVLRTGFRCRMPVSLCATTRGWCGRICMPRASIWWFRSRFWRSKAGSPARRDNPNVMAAGGELAGSCSNGLTAAQVPGSLELGCRWGTSYGLLRSRGGRGIWGDGMRAVFQSRATCRLRPPFVLLWWASPLMARAIQYAAPATASRNHPSPAQAVESPSDCASHLAIFHGPFVTTEENASSAG